MVELNEVDKKIIGYLIRATNCVKDGKEFLSLETTVEIAKMIQLEESKAANAEEIYNLRMIIEDLGRSISCIPQSIHLDARDIPSRIEIDACGVPRSIRLER